MRRLLKQEVMRDVGVGILQCMCDNQTGLYARKTCPKRLFYLLERRQLSYNYLKNKISSSCKLGLRQQSVLTCAFKGDGDEKKLFWCRLVEVQQVPWSLEDLWRVVQHGALRDSATKIARHGSHPSHTHTKIASFILFAVLWRS
jgi:hypothetical protein